MLLVIAQLLGMGGSPVAAAVAAERTGSAAVPFGLLALGAHAGWALPGAGGYLLYRGDGNDPAAIDWISPIGFGQAGEAIALHRDADLAASGRWSYGLRTVSDAGVIEDGTACSAVVQTDAEGALIGPRPNAIVSASAEAAAAGRLRLRFAYDAAGQLGAASVVAVARKTADAYDWESPVAEISVRSRGLTIYSGLLDPTYAHGEQVALACRAQTAAGVAGPLTILRAVRAKAAAPAAPASLALEQVSR